MLTEQSLRARAEAEGHLDPLRDAFGVWLVEGNRAVWCGSRREISEAFALGRQHVHLKNIWVLPAEARLSAVRLDDGDRVPGAACLGTWPGSGVRTM